MKEVYKGHRVTCSDHGWSTLSSCADFVGTFEECRAECTERPNVSENYTMRKASGAYMCVCLNSQGEVTFSGEVDNSDACATKCESLRRNKGSADPMRRATGDGGGICSAENKVTASTASITIGVIAGLVIIPNKVVGAIVGLIGGGIISSLGLGVICQGK